MHLLFTLLVLCFASALGLKAQVGANPLCFMGVAIEGDPHTFAKRLEAKGFTEVKREADFILMKGHFTGSDVHTTIMSARNKIYSVGVFLDSYDNWRSLVNQYEQYKKMYIRKYGDPTSTQEIPAPLNATNRGQMRELQEGGVTYGSKWMMPLGEISMSINKAVERFLAGQVCIVYTNTEAQKRIAAERLKDI